MGIDGQIIKGFMQSLMKRIADDIEVCGSACDVYMKKSFLSKCKMQSSIASVPSLSSQRSSSNRPYTRQN